MISLIVVIFPISEVVVGASAQEWEYVAEARAGAYEIAQFSLWLPDEQETPRAALVLVPGFNGDGRKMAKDNQWRELAKRFNLLIVACYFKGGSYHSSPQSGSGQALLGAMKAMGEKIGKKGFDELPMILWGHSAGGQFNFNMLQWKPKQVLTFVVNKGAYYASRRDKKARKVPGLFFIGTEDAKKRDQNITGIYMEGREKGAPWCLIREAGEGHGVGKSKIFSIRYFETVIPLRLPDGISRLQNIRLDDGWLGHLETSEISSASATSWKKEESVWLPDRTLADLWKEIVLQ